MRRRRRKGIVLSVALALTLAVTVNVVLQVRCETTVIVNCDFRCHQTQAILQLAKLEADHQKGVEEGRWTR